MMKEVNLKLGETFITSELIEEVEGHKTYDSIQWEVVEIKSLTVDDDGPKPNIIVRRIK